MYHSRNTLDRGCYFVGWVRTVYVCEGPGVGLIHCLLVQLLFVADEARPPLLWELTTCIPELGNASASVMQVGVSQLSRVCFVSTHMDKMTAFGECS